jgi:hypothetical protein
MPATRATRTRAKAKAAQAEAMPIKEGKFFARLDLGARYEVLGRYGRAFTQGQVVEIDAATHRHLATKVELRRAIYKDGELGRIERCRHPFSLSPAIDPIPDRFLDCVED